MPAFGDVHAMVLERERQERRLLASQEAASKVAFKKMTNGHIALMKSTTFVRNPDMNVRALHSAGPMAMSSRSLSSSSSAPQLASSGSSSSLLTAAGRGSNLDALVLVRPKFTSTYDEHTWQGAMPKLHPHAPLPDDFPPRQSSFSLRAYKRGNIKPSAMDPKIDRTVTEFMCPHPSRSQLKLAKETYSGLGREWGTHVQSMHEKQQDLDARYRQSLGGMRRSQTAQPFFGFGSFHNGAMAKSHMWGYGY